MQRNKTQVAIILGIVVACNVMPSFGFIITSGEPTPWLTTASGLRIGNGAPATITWSIIPDGTAIKKFSGSYTTSDLIYAMNIGFGGNLGQSDPALQPWFHLFTDAFERWSELGGVHFVYEPQDDGVPHPGADGVLGVRGDIRIGGLGIDNAGGALAFTYLPPNGSDIAIDTRDLAIFTNGSNFNYVYFRDTLMQQIGHAFGLEHVNTNDVETGKLLMQPYLDLSAHPIDGPQLDEVRAVHYFFGDANEEMNGGLGNGTAARATSLGAISPGGVKWVGASANVPTQAIGPTAKDFVSISNASDADYYSFSLGTATLLSVTLKPRGGIFAQSAVDPNQTPTTFDANARNDLAVAVLSTDGSSILATLDAKPAGSSESIANLVLPAAGTYYVRITGAQDRIQLYELSLWDAPILPGDYNRDNVVDTSDFVLWRNTQGDMVTATTEADGNGDGQITSADFDVWRSHFGQSAGAGVGAFASVPEPAATILAAIGTAAVVLTGGGTRRQRSR